MKVTISRFERSLVLRTPMNVLDVLTSKGQSFKIGSKPLTGGMTLQGIDRLIIDRSKKSIVIYGVRNKEIPIFEIYYGKGKFLINGKDLPIKDELIILGRERFPEIVDEEKEVVG